MPCSAHRPNFSNRVNASWLLKITKFLIVLFCQVFHYFRPTSYYPSQHSIVKLNILQRLYHYITLKFFYLYFYIVF